MKTYDVVIVGGGISGFMVANQLKEHSVAIISKSHPLRSNSISTNYILFDDSKKLKINKVIKKSECLSDFEDVEQLFKENITSNFDFEKYKDEVGFNVMNILFQNSSCDILGNYFVIDIAIAGDVCYGVIALDLKTGKLFLINAKVVVLASGGYTKIYHNSVSSEQSSGDIQAILFNKGLPLENMEFVKWNLANANQAIPEQIFELGAKLLNNDKEYYLIKYPNFTNYALATQKEILDGKGIDNFDNVYLDLSKISRSLFNSKINSFNYDYLIKVKPAAQISIGGIKTNKEFQVLSKDSFVDGLYAVGDVANSNVSGANVVMGVPLLELMVGGTKLGIKLNNIIKKLPAKIIPDKLIYNSKKQLKKMIDGSGDENIGKLKLKLQLEMSQNCGIIKTERKLKKLLKFILELKNKRFKLMDNSNEFNIELMELIQLKNLISISEVVVRSALYREESRGCHYRQDYPIKNSYFEKNTLIYKEDDKIIIK